jgi:hypothetical protein
MTKIVYNACYGGFDLSHEAIMLYADIKGINLCVARDDLYNTYYLCSYDEYDAVIADIAANPVGPEEYHPLEKYYFNYRRIERTDPALVKAVEQLGDAANGMCAELRVADIRPGTIYRIEEYDGYEHIMAQDSYKWRVA